ncbi:MAG: hypothetical protein ACKV2T_09395 [Kofleriaceae bacterium]
MLPDAPVPQDGEVVDTPPGGTVTVTVWTGNAQRDATAIVLFQAANGSVVSRVEADNGLASGEVPAGGMVTVVQRSIVTTIAQVAGGDEITVGTDVPSTPGMATVVVPAAPGGTTGMQVYGPCGAGSSTTTTIPFTMSAACPQPAKVVAVARAGAAPQAFVVEDVAIVENEETTLAGPWAAPAQFTATIENVPATVERVMASAGSRIGTSTLYLNPTLLPAPTGGSTTGSIAVPPAFGDGTELRYYLYYQGFTAYQQGSVTVAGATTSHTFDGSDLLPWITGYQGSWDDIAWTQSSGAAYDGAIATIEYQYKNYTQLTWRVILPESARQFTLPDSADIEIPKEVDQSEVHVELIESSAFDWAGMRAKAGATSFRRDDTMPAIRTLRSSTR